MSLTISQEVAFILFFAGAFLFQASTQCSLDTFTCSNQRCIPFSSLCDGRDDCRDNSDEEICGFFPCHPSLFQCLNKKCIARKWFCSDSSPRCEDNSHIDYCDVPSSVPCPPGWTRCLDGRRCIPFNFVCDGFNQCRGGSEERHCVSTVPCPLGWIRCPSGKRCIPFNFVCDGIQQCDDESEEENCDSSISCPFGWIRCPSGRRCIPSSFVCDGIEQCDNGSEERNCGNNTAVMRTKITQKSPEDKDGKSKVKSWFLGRRRPGSGTDRWGPQVHRIAVALHLADNSTFGPGNRTGDEIRFELTTQLLHRLANVQKLSSQELALYIHAMIVSCIDPRDFYGVDLVRELRERVEASGNFTNPFLILALCNAGDVMTAKDVERVNAAYDSQHRPFWTDFQAMSSMALSCISSSPKGVSVDERVLRDMLQELKRRQFRNGTVDNFRTTALVTQALFIHIPLKRILTWKRPSRF